MTVFNSTKSKQKSIKDSRPPIFGRKVTSTFKPYFAFKHAKGRNVNVFVIPFIVFASIIKNLPFLISMRFYLKKVRKNKDCSDISVLYYSDNLDEVNGIANNLRHVVNYMQKNGYKAGLAGSAFNTRPTGVIENSYIFLTPRLFSMEQLGYANSELAIPNLSPVLKLFKRYPPDIIELETPSPGAWVVAFGAKIMGIKVISHYRTDVPTYTKTLVKEKWMHHLVLFLMRVFYKMTMPVISPCQEYQKILQEEIRIPSDQIQILPRGIPLEDFSPQLRGKGAWARFASDHPVRFLFVGRISKEKDLPFLEDLWMSLREKTSQAELLFVGDGWYLDSLKKNFQEAPEVFFAGEQGGETLASLYADADYFLFPSGTDTFGNVVVESLASGTPAIVTDKGGPQDIIKGKDCGFVLKFRDKEKWLDSLLNCIDIKINQPHLYAQMRENAFKTSRIYSLENTSKNQWEYFKKLCKNYYKKPQAK